ncbi:probable G-protein coupled receptor Mth-like 3 isoform X1 [Orussus abietinus]|uniref:probable G-protein coupled receptor Mth-like 3 isoform X1 n=1 Tax=Orussus abietinus TaxID=222816 RepID=UPI000C715D22|nr:probable G-protein coupled receptor Mth-like 3 isoform X1 [Orussus abietinus]
MIGRGLLGIFLALHLGSTRDPETGGLEEGRILRKDGGDGRFHRGLGSTTEKLETKEEIVPRNNRDENGETNICPSSSLPCVSFCCPPGHFLRDRKCNQDGNRSIPLPAVYEDDLRVSNLAFNEENFLFVVWDPCQGGERYPLYSHEYPEERFFLLKNGSVVTPFLKNAEVLLFAQYCLTRLPEVEEYLVLFCYHKVVGMEAEDPDDKPTFYPVGMIISVPFLVATFVIYAILPELRNLHGLTLRGYVGSLAVAYANLTVVQISSGNMPDSTCIALAFIIHFSFLASFFWLNVMCFDIWWTFGGFRSLQGSAKQREKKKFIMYSIYAWGCATLLTAVCMVMDLVPGIPKHYIRPEFGVGSCWYYTNMARAIYFYGPMGVTVACNICLFVSTAIKIVRHKKDTAHHLKGSDSRRHDDNKQWFNLYLKLFIVMGISWSMEIISWLFEESSPKYIWYVSDIGNTLQGVIIFVIFVWKSKIKRLLLKRFGCQDRNFLSRESTRSAYNSSSRTCTTSAPLQEKANPYVDANFRQKTTSEDSDDV